MNTMSSLWQAVYNAYESHDVDEARRLLNCGTQAPDCSTLLRCKDIDYVRWLLSNELLPLPADSRDTWPGIQEILLQCSMLSEAARPDCILKGDLPAREHEK